MSCINQLLINSIKILPNVVLDIIKDYLFLTNIQKFIKIHIIRQILRIEMDITLFYIIQRAHLTYRISYADEDECEFYYPFIHNCRNCGNYLVNKKCCIDSSYVPYKIRCFC